MLQSGILGCCCASLGGMPCRRRVLEIEVDSATVSPSWRSSDKSGSFWDPWFNVIRGYIGIIGANRDYRDYIGVIWG